MTPLDSTARAPRILVADDDELMRELIAAALVENGIKTIEVSNGQEALETLQKNPVDLVILDVAMPVMDGFETCSRIRAMEAGRDLPIVIVTGNEDAGSIDRAYDLGATDFISKPVNWTLLGHRIRYVLRGAETRAALAAREAENRAMLEAIPDRVILLKPNGDIITLITNASDQGIGTDGNQAKTIEQLLPKDAVGAARLALQDVLIRRCEVNFEYVETLQLEDISAVRFYEARMVPQSNNIVLAILRDVSRRKQAEARIHRLAYFDTLTDMPNRHQFMERIDEVVRHANTATDRFLLCALNLDQFKRINDTLGQAAGDNILIEFSARLRAHKERLRANHGIAEVARLGADQFALFATLTSGETAPQLMDDLAAELSEPLVYDRHQVVITSSMGSAQYPTDGADVASLLKNAERAMTGAKKSGRNQHRSYSPADSRSSEDQLMLENDLRRAISSNELILFFQPKFDLSGERITGAEALLRWLHPTRGIISPGVFIPIAEETGLILDIDRWVVEQTCQCLKQWQSSGIEVVPVSLNLSGRQFCFAQPEITLARALQNCEIDPSYLEIEITETMLMSEPDSAAEKLNILKSMGIRLAIDDFGTGYSSLGYLKHFQLDVLKIDRTFVTDLEHSENDRALCRTIISMAASLGLEVVAEGVETEAQRKFLQNEGCNTAQGFLLAEPMSADHFQKRLSSNLPPVLRLIQKNTG